MQKMSDLDDPFDIEILLKGKNVDKVTSEEIEDLFDELNRFHENGQPIPREIVNILQELKLSLIINRRGNNPERNNEIAEQHLKELHEKGLDLLVEIDQQRSHIFRKIAFLIEITEARTKNLYAMNLKGKNKLIETSKDMYKLESTITYCSAVFLGYCNLKPLKKRNNKAARGPIS